VFEIVVSKAGVYPFRMVWEETGGSAHLEWYSIDLDTDTNVLINDPNTADSIKAYRTMAAPPATPPTISVVNSGDGTITVTFEGKLQAASTVNGPWADVEGAVSPQIIPVDEVMLFGRAVK